MDNLDKTQDYLETLIKTFLYFLQARAFFQTSSSLAPHLFEPSYNLSTLAEKSGDLQTSYVVVQKALKNFPEHRDSIQLLKQLEKHFAML